MKHHLLQEEGSMPHNSPGKMFDWFRSIFFNLSSFPLILFSVYEHMEQILIIPSINYTWA